MCDTFGSYCDNMLQCLPCGLAMDSGGLLFFSSACLVMGQYTGGRVDDK